MFRSNDLFALLPILVDILNYALGVLRFDYSALRAASINRIAYSIASHALSLSLVYEPLFSPSSHHSSASSPSPLVLAAAAASEINASADTAAIVCWVFDSRVNEFNPERSRRYRSIRENLGIVAAKGAGKGGGVSDR